jgi:flagellar basal-body rod modification protein FlgD
MSSDYYSSASYLLGQAEELQAASNSAKANSKLDQEDFLTILVAQLTHQDPTNPMDDTQMVNQLTQYSMLEQLTNINSGINSLVEASDNQDIYSATNFIGKSVKAQGYTVTKDGDSVSSIYYGMGEAVSGIQVNIYDSEGNIVYSETLGSRQAGTYQFDWDGTNSSGTAVPDGTYSVSMLGEDADGKTVLIQTEVSGVVSGVVSSGGELYLTLDDGRTVNYKNVTEIVSPTAAGDDSDS